MSDSDPDADAQAALRDAETRHAPVLLDEIVAALAPEAGGVFLDGTFGAGGYARALIARGAARVIGIDRDPEALARARAWSSLYPDQLTLVEGRFGALDAVAAEAGAPLLQGVALDIGVSSMQLDQPARGFSFLRDGPLDMRMEGASGEESAAEVIAERSESALADIFFYFGEERRARRIARAVVAAREEAPIKTTARLAAIVEAAVGGRFAGGRSGRAHPATQVFQALRIAVNDELGELERGLAAAERVLAPEGVLAVVSFHSLEDRMVKRFFADRFGGGGGSRHQPELNHAPATFVPIKPFGRKAVEASEAERARNPRARSAKLRVGRRLETPARALAEPLFSAPPAGREAAARGAKRRRR